MEERGGEEEHEGLHQNWEKKRCILTLAPLLDQHQENNEGLHLRTEIPLLNQLNRVYVYGP